MKAAVILYHKNIQSIYQPRWVQKSVDSILSQTWQNFDLFELNYGGKADSVLPVETPHGKHFYSQALPNHAFAANFILDKVFEGDYDLAFNVHLDDYYAKNRFELQVKAIQQGVDIVSSDFCYIQEKEGEDVVTHHLNILRHGDIQQNLNRNHNMIAHPVVCFSRKFWKGNNRYQDELPMEDMKLWQRSIKKGYKFQILPEELLFYRIHDKQTSASARN